MLDELNKSKICNNCKEEKLLNDFYKCRTHKDGLSYKCKKCDSDLSKKRRIEKYGESVVKTKEEVKEHFKKYQREYRRNRRKCDDVYRLRNNITSTISKLIKKNGYGKESRTYEIIGCSYEELLNYLNDNQYKFRYEDGLYDIDHVIPISSAESEDELIELCHYTNLQLLPSEYNRQIKKDNNWDKEHFEKWLNEKFNYE